MSVGEQHWGTASPYNSILLQPTAYSYIYIWLLWQLHYDKSVSGVAMITFVPMNLLQALMAFCCTSTSTWGARPHEQALIQPVHVVYL